MNDSNLTSRQKHVLNFINGSNGLSREEIQAELEKTYNLSKPTLIRDLSRLLEKGLISTRGKGKNVKYFPLSNSPLLRQFDVTQYFQLEPDKRIGARKNFDFGVFDNLKDLFTPLEIEGIQSFHRSFLKQTGRLKPDILKREMERFVIELSWKSSKIEGNTYSLLETESLIKDRKEAKGHSREEAVMILNHKEAFEQIMKNPAIFKEITVSEVNQLHNIMVKDLGITQGIRENAVGITGTVYKPLDNKFQIEEAMEKFKKALNSTASPLEKALIANTIISYIQPYADGNKRTGRMLANAVLLAHDYYPLSYRSVDEGEFKKALILFYEQESIYYLKKIFIEQLKFAYDTYFK